jgi:hypothetical protein
MRLKSLALTTALLAVISGLVWFLNRPAPPPSADARLGQPLASTAVIEKAAKLRISDQGKSVTVVRQADGSWRVPSYYDMPADFAKITGLIGNLTEAKIERLVTSNAERIARLEFKDTKIDLLDAGDKEVWTVTLGKNPDAGGGRFVRFGTEPKAFLASLNAWLDTEPKNWANSELLSLTAGDIAKVEIPFAEGGPVAVSRAKKDDAWIAANTPAGQKVKADRISSLLSSLGSLRFTETNDLTDANFSAARAHERLFRIETFDHKIIKIGLGRKPEEKKLKPPAPSTDGKTGPASLGSMADLGKPAGQPKGEDKKPEDAKPLAPEYDTIPAGPVFVTIAHGDGEKAPINALMAKRAFQISDYTFTGLPQKADELFEPVPPPAVKAPEAMPAEPKKP